MKPDQRALPVARRDDLIVEELPGEVVVYDLRTHQVHCLNRTAALAWSHCDGRHTRADLAAALEREFHLPPDEAVLDLALAALTKAALLPAAVRSPNGADLSRRRMVRRLALASGAAALLPTVKSAQAQGGGFLGSCAIASGCISGVNDCVPCFIPTPAPEHALEAQCEKRRCWQGNCRPKQQTNCV